MSALVNTVNLPVQTSESIDPSTHPSLCYYVSLFPLVLPQWMSLSSLIRVWCQCLEVFVVVPPAGDVSPRIRRGDGSCVHLKRWGSERAFVGGGRNSFTLSFLTILFFLAGKHQRRLFDPTCVSLRDPLPERRVARLHSHTPCPPCLDWFSVRILEGITAICRLLRNKGGSSLSSLQYFRGITWPDKHAFAPLCTCSLFCLDLSTHPNCPLNFKADHVILSCPPPALWIEATHQFLQIAHYKKMNMSQCLIKKLLHWKSSAITHVVWLQLALLSPEDTSCALQVSIFSDVNIHSFHSGIITPSCARALWEQGNCQLGIWDAKVVMDFRLIVSWCRTDGEAARCAAAESQEEVDTPLGLMLSCSGLDD